MKRRKLRSTRPKALFGEVAAAGITAAATLAAAGIGAAATAKAAKEQSAATIEQAKQQAQAIEQTNQNNNQLQQQSQQFIASENEANRQIQRDLQMNLQLQGGALDTEQRRMASRIQVKHGGKVKSRKKLRDAQFPLRGSNTGIKVTDGGYLEYIGDSPEGYPLYKAHGDTHKQYHKVGKKYKSGIGIKVPGRETIEVENGETLADRLMSPHGDVAIASRLSHAGAYPAQMIDNGAPVDDVINLQEMVNINNGNSPVEKNRYKALAGASTNYILPTDYPIYDLGYDMAPINVALGRRQLKKGGRCKAAGGMIVSTNFIGPRPYGFYTPARYTPFDKWYGTGLTPTLANNNNLGTTPRATAYEINGGNNKNNSGFYRGLRGISGNLIGAGINTLGNLGGALLTNWGASRASKYLSKAYTEAGNLLAGAYDKLQTVDVNSLNRDMFAAQHYMPVVQSLHHNVNPQLSDTNREFRRLMRATNANTLGSAARLSRMVGANATADEQRSRIYAEQANIENQYKQADQAALNEAAANNAKLAIESSKDFTGHYLDLLKYNNDIVNERITGKAQALADSLMGGANARAGYMQSAGQSMGNALYQSAKGFSDAIALDTKQNNEMQIARMTATRPGELSYLKRMGSPDEIYGEVNRLYGIIQSPTSTQEQKNTAQQELIYLTSNVNNNTSYLRYLTPNRLRSLGGIARNRRDNFAK